MSSSLIRAVSRLVPQAEISIISQDPWHSLTFAGRRLTLDIVFRDNDSEKMAEGFARDLDVAEFNVPGQIVADIAVIDCIVVNGRTRLLVSTLLIDD